MSKIGFGFPPATAYFSPYDGSLGVAPTAAQGSSKVWLDTKIASASSTLDFETGLDGTYPSYLFIIAGLKPSATAGFWLRISIDGGATYKSGALEYGYVLDGRNNSGTALTQSSGAGDSKIILQSSVNGVSATAGFNGHIMCNDIASGLFEKTFHITNYYVEATTAVGAHSVGGGKYSADSSPINAVRFFPSTGNFSSGSISLYGIKSS